MCALRGVQGLEQVNCNLKEYASRHRGVVTYLDCGVPFFAGPNQLSAELLPDALHPSLAGEIFLHPCMRWR